MAPIDLPISGRVETAVPIAGGNTLHTCDGDCGGAWSIDGKLLFLAVAPGKLAIPVGADLFRIPLQ
jgi:hypothetical protein